MGGNFLVNYGIIVGSLGTAAARIALQANLGLSLNVVAAYQRALRDQARLQPVQYL